MVRRILSEATKKLSEITKVPSLEARVLLSHTLGRDARLVFDITDEEKAAFEALLLRRLCGEPVAYITGEKEFMSLNFRVTPDVLIPRPDTETLVEAVIEEYKEKTPRVLDLCTGSGCIGISIAKYNKGASVTLSDVSEKALAVAKENAARNGVSAEIKIIDVLNDGFGAGFDVITANPPYIASSVMKTLDVAKFEPHLALDGGEDGLIFYRAIIGKARDALNDDGMLFLEIGYDQADEACALAREHFREISVQKDLGGNDRVVVCHK